MEMEMEVVETMNASDAVAERLVAAAGGSGGCGGEAGGVVGGGFGWADDGWRCGWRLAEGRSGGVEVLAGREDGFGCGPG